MGLKKHVLCWFATGEIGQSSKAMAFCAAGVNGNIDHPYDPADLRRCMLLVEQIPEIEVHFDKIAKLSDTWEQIILNWHDLIRMLKVEMESGNEAPVTYKMLREIRART